MTQEKENYSKLKDFFGSEYYSLKAYVNARLRTGAENDAEDVLQDVALKLFAGADRYSPIDNVAAFVYHSIRNKIIDIMRGNKRSTPREKLTESGEAGMAEMEEGDPQELEAALLTHIRELKPVYREVILAIDFEGYSYKELARESGIPEGTLMSRRHRAISQLYQKMEPLKNL